VSHDLYEEVPSPDGLGSNMDEEEGGIAVAMCRSGLRGVTGCMPRPVNAFNSGRNWVEARSDFAQAHLWCSVILMLVFVGLDAAFFWSSATATILCSIVAVVMVVAMVMHVRFVVRNMQDWLRLRDVWLTYIATVLEFTCIYALCFKLQSDAFRYTDSSSSTEQEELDRAYLPRSFVRFLYLSVSTQTHIGLNDMVPWAFLPDVVSTVQMGLGMLLVVAFVVCINRKDIKDLVLYHSLATITQRSSKQVAPSHSLSVPVQEALIVGARNESRADCTGQVPRSQRTKGCGLCPDCCPELLCRCSELTLRFLYHNLFLVALLLQVACTITLWTGRHINTVMYVCLAVQILSVVLILIFSYYLALNTKVHFYFLAQSIGATTFIFAGAYITIAIFDPSGFHVPVAASSGGGHAPISDEDIDGAYLNLLAQFVHFSFSIMTSTGSSEVLPSSSATRLLVTCHMLASVLFTVIIIGLGLRAYGVSSLELGGSRGSHQQSESGDNFQPHYPYQETGSSMPESAGPPQEDACIS